MLYGVMVLKVSCLEQTSHVVCDYLKDTSKTPFLPVIRQCKSNAHEGSIPPSVMTQVGVSESGHNKNVGFSQM